jgi:hypothetical protein
MRVFLPVNLCFIMTDYELVIMKMKITEAGCKSTQLNSILSQNPASPVATSMLTAIFFVT